MIIVEVVRESAAQMGLVEHDHVVQTFPADGADQAFDKRILPRGARRNELLFQSQPQGPPHKFQTVNAIAIAEQIAGWLSVGESLGQLLRRPSGRRRIGDIEMQNFAARMGEHEEDIEDAEGGGRNDQEIHGHQILGVVVEEGLPGLVAAAGLRTILADGGIRDFDSKFGQFGLDAFAAPGGVAGPHLPNEVDELSDPRWVGRRGHGISSARTSESPADAKR